MLTILSLLVTLSVLILIHEWGHFAAAKWVGIQVPRFSLGLGPKVWGFRRGETEYVLSAIPLGGYVKMAGMEDDEAQSTLEGGDEGEPVDPDRTFDSKPIWARTLVISAGVIMNLLFAVLTYAVVVGAYGERVIATTRIDPGDPATLTGRAAELAARIPYGSRVMAVGDRPVANWSELEEALLDGPEGPVTLRLENRPAVTVELPASRQERLEMFGGIEPILPPVVGGLERGGAADRAGLKPGDRILSVNGRAVRDWGEFVRIVRPSAGRPLRLSVQRGAGTVQLTAVPRAERVSVPGRGEVQVGRLGLLPQEATTGRRRVGFLGAIERGFRYTWETAAMIGDVLRRLVTGQMSTSNLGGLISIGEASGESARMGLEYFLTFLALFSVNLAVLNLLPIPILDGGHLMFLLAEAVRGRPLSVETRVRLSQLGLIVVVALMLLANGNDVVKVVQRWVGG